MEESDDQLRYPFADPRSITIDLATQTVSLMLNHDRAPSLELMVETVEGMRDMMPDTFDNQIMLLRIFQKFADTNLKKAGKNNQVVAIGKIIESLELCGEIPAWSFDAVVERSRQMEPFAAGHYLEGIEGLAYLARERGPERHLIALLVGADDLDAPFAWSADERELL